MADRTLFVSPFFHPEPISTGKWNTHVACELAAACELTVACGHPFYPEWSVRECVEGVAGMEVVRLRLPRRYPADPVRRRALLEIAFAATLARFALRRRGRFSRIVAVSPPSLFLLLLALFGRARRIVIVHDLQSVHTGGDRLRGASLVARLVRLIERAALRSADRLVFLSAEMRARAVADFALAPERCGVAYPFRTIERFEDRGRLAHLLPAEAGHHVVYSGALGEKQNPDALVAILRALSARREDCLCHVFSAGPAFERLAAAESAPGLRFHPLVDEGDLPELLLRSAVQLIPQAPGTSAGSLPSKLPNVLASPARVFAITDAGSELERLVGEASGGLASTTWETAENVARLSALLDGPPLEMRRRLALGRMFRVDTLVEELLERRSEA